MSLIPRRGAAQPADGMHVRDLQRPAGNGRRVALLALAAYCCLSAAVFGRQALGDVRHVVEGFGASPEYYGRDQSFYVWSLAWAARSVTHSANLFLTNAVFAPVGYNLAWAASIPGPALLMTPVTLVLGAVTSYNILALAAPATAAWTAFLLCRHLAGKAPAAFAGGLLFGFGTYESAEMVNHLSLALVALLPLAALLVLRRHARLTSRRRFIIALGLVLALQLWTASEVFASMVIFGVLAFLTGAVLAGRGHWPHIRATAAETLGALVLALLLGLPYLYYALRYPNALGAINGVDGGADLANFLIPTQVTWLHGVGGAAAAADLKANITEQLAYVGLPLLLLLGSYTIELRRSVLGRCLLAFMLAAVLASLGGHLFVDGHTSGVPLPWSLAGRLPLVRFAIPGRFIVYAWLAAAIALSCWLARPSRTLPRWGAFAVVAVSLTPNLVGVPWGTRVDAPPLLADHSQLARYVPVGSTALALPFGIAGNSMFWQVEADFRIRLAGGYVSLSVPSAYRRYIHVIRALEAGPFSKKTAHELCAFIRFTGARVILLRNGAPGTLHDLLDSVGLRAQHAGGFSIYQLTPSASSGGRRACG